MKVTATQRGYYGGHLRQPGDEFVLGDAKADFSKLWMKKSRAIREESSPDEYSAVHKGGGSWDVVGPDGEVAENGTAMKRASAMALAEELNGEGD